jgi:O-methyltransferase
MKKNSIIPSQFSGIKGTQAQMDELKGLLLNIARLLKDVDYWQTDNLMTFGKNLSFLDDEKLLKAALLHANHEYDKAIIWRTHILCWAAQNALRAPGDLVECGTHLGYSVSVVTDYLDVAIKGRRYWCYDLFEGPAYEGLDLDGKKPIDFVRHKLKGKEFISLVKGDVPDSLQKHGPTEVAFLHMDLNSAIAEEGALMHLVPLMPKGAIVVLDDYGWINYKPQKIVADKFFSKKNIPIAELPTGQGLVLI